MERLEKQKIIIFLFSIICMGSCNSHKEFNCTFTSAIEAYKLQNDGISEERFNRIMQFLNSFDTEYVSKGTETIHRKDYDKKLNYIAHYNGSDFKNLNFIPSSDYHSGIAFIYEYDTYIDDDSLKIYFPDSIRAKAFVDDAIKHGCERVDYSKDADFIDIDSTDIKRTLYAADYFDKSTMKAYSIRVMSEMDNNLVVLHYCP